jgi:hypothetical protein
MLRQIPVYAAEREAGLHETITSEANLSVAALCPLVNPHEDTRNSLFASTEKFKEALAKNVDQFDLHYLYTILVTSGWNRNDDVFPRSEIVGARNTPVDKPFNVEHDPNRIIGHITGSVLVNDDWQVLQSDCMDDLPAKFHILTSAVIYKHLSGRDETLTKATSEMLEQIARGEWFVSMECLFSDFDYAVIDRNDKHHVIARNADSAFLTKHLRAYGGQGVYQDKRIGRMMRSLAFTGKGLVRNPGNEPSVIIDDVNAFKGVFASIEKDPIIINRGEGSMSDNSEKLVQLESSNRELHGEVADLRDRLKKMDEEKVTAAFQVKDDEIATLKSEAADLQKTLDESVAAKNEADKELETLKTAKADIDKQLEDVTATISQIEAEKTQVTRVSSLIDAGLEKADAEELASKFEKADDEMFEAVVAQQREHAEAIKDKKPISSPKKDNKGTISSPKKDTKSPIATASENDDDATDLEDETTATAADLDDIEGENGDVPLATAGETEASEEDKKMEALSSFLGGQLSKADSK